MNQFQISYENETGQIPVGEFGSMSVRVVVLPKKKKLDKNTKASQEQEVLDLEEGEVWDEKGATAMSSYLETSKGGRQCCVFLVNGQRQDSLDNSFIIQSLGYKYLRHRMMIIADVDNLNQEALGRLMQGSRQTFYHGDVFDAIVNGLVATLKNDPDLDRLEQEAEEEVAELRAGDAKVKQTLDQLIDSHHQYGHHFDEGHGARGQEGEDEHLGLQTQIKDGVVSLLRADEGVPAEYPVLVSQPASSSIRLRPNQTRSISLQSIPANAWPAISELSIEQDVTVPELAVSQEQLSDHLRLTLLFSEPEGFDADQYPIRASLKATARFNGIKEPRLLDLKVLIRPDVEAPDPELLPVPTWISVSSRQPVRIRAGSISTHARLRWNGLDELISGPQSSWKFYASQTKGGPTPPAMIFSDPRRGRFSLLITPREEWEIGQKLSFRVLALGPEGQTLSAEFDSVVVETPTPDNTEREPRKVDADINTGSARRPPYDLKYIDRDAYDTETCWSDHEWSDEEPGCFQAPTERSPLTLIINNDLAALLSYKKYLTKKFTEGEVERRINKYTSHVAFHLYQMYEAVEESKDVDYDEAERRARREIQRVSSTLIKLMEVSR